MSDNDETIPASRGLRARRTQHFKAWREKTNGGWKAWALALLGGAAVSALGVGSLVLVDKVPWWASFLVIVAGLQIASRGAFGKGLLILKDAAIDIMRAKKDAA